MLPSIQSTDLAAAIQKANFVPETQSTGDEVFCTYKPYVGDYLIGRDQDSIKGEEVLFVTDMLAVGWILWHEGVCYEEFSPFISGLPPKPVIPRGIEESCEMEGDDWNPGRGVMFVTDDGLNVIWKAATMGMRKAVDPVFMEIIKRSKEPENAGYLYPKVTLNVAEPYKSKKGGKIYNPKLDIVSWHNKAGDIQTEEKALEEDNAPLRRRNRKAA